MQSKPVVRLAAAMLSLLTMPAAAMADSVSDFYQGKRLTVVCGCSAGGVYDVFSRFVAQYMPKHIPGQPQMIVQNMPGAGGAVSANHMANLAAKDGTTLSVPLSSVVLAQVLTPNQIKYDATKFGWLGIATPMTETISVLSNSPATTIAQAKTTQLIIGATAKNSQSYQEPALAAALLGLKFKITTGYEGGTLITLAMERGEVHGKAQAWTTWQEQRPDWIKENKIVHLMQIGTKDPALPNVPALVDLVTTEREKAMAGILDISSDTGLALYTAPDVPVDRLAALRGAFGAMMKDAEFVKVMKEKINQTVQFKSGEDFQAYVVKSVATPKDIVDDVNKIIQ
ncbi:MAG TPA: tripartite tricarboxylate transporter substrate-binding protein [Alphaproteobacteria bacterium]|nr:tripartite tricarboxylate transporter substrate-binding protein [Alphaproteobacteria bacterium]